MLAPYMRDWCRGSSWQPRIEPGARVVTFGNGMVFREPIIDLDDSARRLVWSAEGAGMTHYDASVQVLAGSNNGSRIVWIADLLPNDLKGQVEAMMDQGMSVMKATLDGLAKPR